MTLLEVLRRRGADPVEGARPWLRFEDEVFPFARALAEARRFAHLFLRHRPEGRPFHVGILMENRPELVFAELGIGMAGGAMVGLNPTRRGPHLARDVAYRPFRRADLDRLLDRFRRAGTESRLGLAP